MAAPESVRQSAGISATGYSPVVTQLSTPNMGSPGAGQLWAQVGDTAMKAGSIIGNLPQQMAANKSAMQGIQHYNWLNSLPNNMGQVLTYTDANGRTVTMPAAQISNPALANAFREAIFPTTPPAPGKAKGNDPGEAAEKDQDQKPATKQPPPAGQGPYGGLEERNAPLPSPPPGTRPGDLLKTSATTTSPNAVASTWQGPTQSQTDVAVREALARNQFASTGQGVPSNYQPPSAPSGPGGAPPGMFMNPATGTFESLQTQPPAAPADDQAARDRATVQQHQAEQDAQDQQQQAQQSQVAAQQQAAGQAKQQQLAQWQAQNAHPVADSQSALEWAKRYHTGYKTATYLPHGGPGGEPAYNFSDGKSANIVPISQMVKNGFGPSVAAQSTSAVLGVADQIGQNGQGPTGPGLPFGPVSPAAQTAQQPPAQQPPAQPPPPGQQPPPPAAPGPSPPSGLVWNPQRPAPGQPAPTTPGGDQQIRDIYGNPLSAYTSVASRGGPTLAQLTAQTAPAGQPAQLPNPVNPNGTPITNEQLDRDVPVQPHDAKADKDPEASDQDLGWSGGLHWFQDRHTDQRYTIAKSPSSILNQQRWYPQIGSWQDMPMENSELRRELMEARKNTPGITPSDEEIRDKPIQWIKDKLQLAKLYHATSGDPNTTLAIQGKIYQSKALARIIDGYQAATDAGIDPREFSTGEAQFSKEAADAGAMQPAAKDYWGKDTDPTSKFLFGMLNRMGVSMPPQMASGHYINTGALWHYLQSQFHESFAGSGQVQPFAEEMARDTRAFGSAMGQTPSLRYTADGKPIDPPITGEVIGPYGVAVKGSVPAAQKESPLDELNRVMSGTAEDPKTVLYNLKQLQARINRDLIDTASIAGQHNYRVPREYESAVNDLIDGRAITDDTNPYRDKNTGKLSIPEHLRAGLTFPSEGETPSPKPGPTPMATVGSDADWEAFKKNHHRGDHFMAPDGRNGFKEFVY